MRVLEGLGTPVHAPPPALGASGTPVQVDHAPAAPPRITVLFRRPPRHVVVQGTPVAGVAGRGPDRLAVPHVHVPEVVSGGSGVALLVEVLVSTLGAPYSRCTCLRPSRVGDGTLTGDTVGDRDVPSGLLVSTCGTGVGPSSTGSWSSRTGRTSFRRWGRCSGTSPSRYPSASC